MNNFGERLRRLRGNASQKHVAQQLGIPQTTLSTFENQQNVPRGEVLKRLAGYYGVPITYFYPQELHPAQPTQKARDLLNSLRHANPQGRDTIATHTDLEEDVDFREETKRLVAEKIHKLAKTQIDQ